MTIPKMTYEMTRWYFSKDIDGQKILVGWVRDHHQMQIPIGGAVINTSPIVKEYTEDGQTLVETQNTIYNLVGPRQLKADEMDNNFYIQNVLKTEARDYGPVAERLQNPALLDNLEFLMDQAKRIGDHQDNLKKAIFYGKEMPQLPIAGFDYDRAKAASKFPEFSTTMRLLHSTIGVFTEAAELQQAIYDHVFNDKNLDRVNLVEEYGDLLWYIGIALDAMGSSFEEAQTRNINKLRARYGEKFTEQAALNRDLNTERQVLES